MPIGSTPAAGNGNTSTLSTPGSTAVDANAPVDQTTGVATTTQPAAQPVLRPAGGQPGAANIAPPTMPGAPSLPNAPMGEVNHSTLAMTLPDSLKDSFVGADALSFDALKRGFRLRDAEHPYLKTPADWFRGHVELSAASLLPKDNAQLKPFKDALGAAEKKVRADFASRGNADIGKSPYTMTVPYNEIQLSPGVYGTRFLPYDGSTHAELIKVIHDPAMQKGIVTKDMVHLEQGNPSGDPTQFFSGDRGSQGFSHGGALIPVTKPGGVKDVAWVDWPTGYGRLNGVSYGGQALLGYVDISTEQKDYSKPLPENFEKLVTQEVQRMRTATALAMATTPFASDDPRSEYSDYHFNPLTVKQGSDVARFVDLIADPTNQANLKELAENSLYCREGVHTVSNFAEAPWNQAAVDAGKLSQASWDKLRAMKAAFTAAGGDAPGMASKGWQALKDQGFITADQLDGLTEQNMNHVPFVLSPDEMKPLSQYGANYLGQQEGLGKDINVKPLTVAGLLRGMMQINFPREKMAGQFSAQLATTLAGAPDAATKAQLAGAAAAVIGNNTAPTDPKLTEKFGAFMAAKMQAGILANEKTREVVRHTVHYEDMDDASKAKVDEYIGKDAKPGKFVELVGNTELSAKQFREKLYALEKEIDSLKVRYPEYSNSAEGDLMSFVPPSRAFLSQHEIGTGADAPFMHYRALGFAVPRELLTAPGAGAATVAPGAGTPGVTSINF